VEILIGDGHHKSAFSYPSPEQPNARRLMVTHNLSDRTISIIDNDPNSATFLQVIKTVGPGNATLPGTDYVPHGMAYSPVSGHIYTGMTNPVDWAVTIIDTTSPDLPVTGIRAGLEAGQIPAAGGYTHAARGGSIIYTAGWKASEDGTTGTGWLSAIDATTNTVVAVIELGNLNASSFIENGQKLYLPSSSASTGNSITNIVAVVGRDATLVDALATGIFVLGPSSGLQLLERLRLGEGMIIDRMGHTSISPSLEAKVVLYEPMQHAQP